MSIKIPQGIGKVQLTIRLDEKSYDTVETISKNKNQSMSFVINTLVKYAINNIDTNDLE